MDSINQSLKKKQTRIQEGIKKKNKEFLKECPFTPEIKKKMPDMSNSVVVFGLH